MKKFITGLLSAAMLFGASVASAGPLTDKEIEYSIPDVYALPEGSCEKRWSAIMLIKLAPEEMIKSDVNLSWWNYEFGGEQLDLAEYTNCGGLVKRIYSNMVEGFGIDKKEAQEYILNFLIVGFAHNGNAVSILEGLDDRFRKVYRETGVDASGTEDDFNEIIESLADEYPSRIFSESISK